MKKIDIRDSSEFRPSDWESMERLLDKQKKRSFFWLFPVAILLGLSLGGGLYFNSLTYTYSSVTHNNSSQKSTVAMFSDPIDKTKYSAIEAQKPELQAKSNKDMNTKNLPTKRIQKILNSNHIVAVGKGPIPANIKTPTTFLELYDESNQIEPKLLTNELFKLEQNTTLDYLPKIKISAFNIAKNAINLPTLPSIEIPNKIPSENRIVNDDPRAKNNWYLNAGMDILMTSNAQTYPFKFGINWDHRINKNINFRIGANIGAAFLSKSIYSTTTNVYAADGILFQKTLDQNISYSNLDLYYRITENKNDKVQYEYYAKSILPVLEIPIVAYYNIGRFHIGLGGSYRYFFKERGTTIETAIISSYSYAQLLNALPQFKQQMINLKVYGAYKLTKRIEVSLQLEKNIPIEYQDNVISIGLGLNYKL